MLTALLTGLGIGLAAGVSPGPLLVLVITSALRGGVRHGLAVAVAPFLSDLVVVTAVLLVLREMPPGALGLLGVVGGLLVVALGVQTIREGRTATLAADGTKVAGLGAAFGRAALVNLVSPHPWITWITMLGPLTVTTWRTSPAGGVALVGGFYLMLVGSKAVLAALVAGGRGRLSETGYRRTVVAAGAALLVFGVAMAAEFGTSLLSR